MFELLETLRGYYDNHIPINIKTLINALMEVDEPRLDKNNFYIQQALMAYDSDFYLYGLCLNTNTGNRSYGNLWFYFTEDSGSNVYIHQFYNFIFEAPEYNINRSDEQDVIDETDTSLINEDKTRKVNITKEIGNLSNFNMYTRDIVFERKESDI